MNPGRAAAVATLAIVSILSACGFQLRGTGGTSLPASWQDMRLVSNTPNSELSREITNRFAAGGVRWSGSNEAAFRLVLGAERFSQRNLSINSQARAAEFELTMQAEFSVLDANGEEVMRTADAAVIKQMENDPGNVVGKDEEIRILKTEMRTELAQQIMRRIGFYAASTQP